MVLPGLRTVDHQQGSCLSVAERRIHADSLLARRALLGAIVWATAEGLCQSPQPRSRRFFTGLIRTSTPCVVDVIAVGPRFA